MSEKEDLEFLLGRTLDERYFIKELLDTTRKSWIFLAQEIGEISPERNVSLKILKPGQGPRRKEQFVEEARRYGKLESHPNIVKVYGGGKYENYFYISMEYIPGNNLQKRVDSGERFSLERIIDFTYSLTEAVSFCHKYGIEHNDIKLKNLKEKKGEEGTCVVLDFGSKFTRDRDSDDVYSIGSVFEELLKHRQNPEEKINDKISEIVDFAKNGKFSSAEEIGEEIKNYIDNLKRKKSRRKFLKTVGGSILLAGTGHFSYKYFDFLNSIDYLVSSNENTNFSDYKLRTRFLLDLKDVLIRDKIHSPLERNNFLSREAETSSEPLSPFAVDENGNWFPDSRNERSGDFFNILLKTSFFDDKHLDYTVSSLDKILLQKVSDSVLKFYYSLAFASELDFIPKEKKMLYKKKAVEAAFLWKQNYERRTIPFSSLDDMEKSLLTIWAIDNSKENKEGLVSHLKDITEKFTFNNISYNGGIISVFPYVEHGLNGKKPKKYVVNPNKEQTHLFNGNNYSVVARDSARLIHVYTLLGDYYSKISKEKSSEYLEIAEKLALQHLSLFRESNYFISNYLDEQVPNKIDNTYLAILTKSVFTLLSHSKEIENREYLEKKTEGLIRRLTLPENIRLEKERGILARTCYKITSPYKTSWIHGDKNFFDNVLLFSSSNYEKNKLIMKF